MNFRWRGIAAATGTLAAVLAAGPCVGQGLTASDYSRVTRVPRNAVDSWIKRNVMQCGVDWNSGRFSFYFVFAGVHADALQAITMRRIVFSLMNNSLAAGDKITAAALNSKTELKATITLDSSMGRRKEFVNSVPSVNAAAAARAANVDRAIRDILSRIPRKEVNSSIILVLHSDSSEVLPKPPGIMALDAATGRYVEVSHPNGGLPQTQSMVLRVPTESGQTQVCLTALFPAKLHSLPGDFGPRYPTFPRESWQPSSDEPPISEALPNAAPTLSQILNQQFYEPGQKSTGVPLPWIVLIIGLCTAIVMASWRKIGMHRAVGTGKGPGEGAV